MNRHIFLFLFVSSLLYVLPFWMSASWWWLLFFFPIPLFYAAFTQELSFKEGYVWGTLTFLLHMSGILFGIASLSPTPFVFCILPFCFGVLYQGVYAALWFWITSCIQKKYQLNKTSILYMLFWVMGMWCYFFYIEHYCLGCFDRCEGYMLMHPLLPLIEQPRLLFLLPYVGSSLLSLWLYMWSGMCALFLVTRNYRIGLSSLVFLIPWFISVMVSYQWISEKPPWLSRIVHIPKMFSCTSSPLMTARIIAEEVRQLLIRYPDADIVIMPESAVLDPCICATDMYASLFSHNVVGKPVHMIVGSFYNDGIYYRNSCYWLYNGIVQNRHDKRHAMPLTECIPSRCDYSCIRNLYFASGSPITISYNARCCFSLSEDCIFVPYICSELFFNQWPNADTYSDPIVLMVNDKWSSAVYVHRLLTCVARFKALLWQRTIMYVSYHYAFVCDQYGGCYVLSSSL